MHLEIKNFRGIAAASLSLDGHLLIAGPNGAGKTSLSMALAAAASGTAAPWADVKAKDARELLREGASRGHVSLSDGEQTVNVNYPGGSVSGELQGVLPSPVALGLASVATMKPADAAMLLAQYMGAEPTQDDLAAAVGADVAAQVWPVIEADGWDAALSRARESGSRLKGQWEGVTGENYGSAKAQGWKPEGADAFDLSGDLAGAVEAAKANLQAVLSQQAVGQDRIDQLQSVIAAGETAGAWLSERGIGPERSAESVQQALEALRARSKQAAKDAAAVARLAGLRELAGRLPDLKQAITDTRRLMDQAVADWQKRKADRLALPSPADKQQTAPCPSCGTHLVVVSRSSLALPESSVSDEENASRAEAIRAADESMNGAAVLVEKRREELSRLQSEAAKAEAAQSELQRLEGEAQPEDLASLSDQICRLSEAVPHLQAREAGRAAGAQLAELQGIQGSTPEQIEAAQHALHDAEIALGLRQSIDRAGKLAAQIARSTQIIAALSPSGVRQEVMSRALEDFNAKLAVISRVAHWNTVKISDNMRVLYGNREYGWQLSESEKFRVRVALQFVMAEIDGSPLVVIDAADILDRKGRNGLVALVKQAGCPVVMTMTMNQQADVPNMSALGVSSWWINEAGEVVPAH